jgi:hypothetical protein
MLNQDKFMREFNESHREQFNPDLFKRDNKEIVQSIYKVLESCQSDKYYTLKLLSFEAIYDYERIYNTLREHDEKRKKKNDKSPNIYDHINIRDTDMILIKVIWLLRHNGIERQDDNGKTVEVINPEKELEVLIAVPRFVNKYYFRISGNYYATIFQIVDGSTYNNSTASQSKVDTVTMKTMFGPIIIFRSFNNLIDVGTGEEIRLIEYQSIIFKNTVNCIYYLLARFGLYGTAAFLGIRCVTITQSPILNPDYYCFEKNGMYINCPKVCFQDAMVQSFIATIYDGIMKETNINEIFNQRFWLKNLGMAFKNASVDKGLFVLDSIEGLYDSITKQDLHLPLEDKSDIYCVLRWLLREFTKLRVKENVDVRTKRIRIADYIAAVYAIKLNKGIHRISDLGTRVTLKKVEQAIYTNPMLVIQKISSASMSNLVSYRDLVNDLDSMVALKYTYKGISGLGEDGASIQPIYRYVDPSHIGILDLDASSASDPGMSGMICPMAKLYGPENSFSEFMEPNNWRNEYYPIQNKFYSNCIQPVSFNNRPQFNFYDNRDRIVKEELDINKVICPVESTIDPSIRFTCSQAKLEQMKQETPKSLFTIRSDIQ